MNKLYRVFGIFLPSWLMLISCSQGKSIEKQLIKMSEIPIRIETEGMVACNDADSVSIIEEGNSRLKMIVWADSTECSKCYGEVFAVAGDDDISFGFEGGIILQRIFKVAKLRGQRVIYYTLICTFPPNIGYMLHAHSDLHLLQALQRPAD